MRTHINEIFQSNISLLSLIDKLIYYFRIQNYDSALRNTTLVIDHLSNWLMNLAEEKDYFNEDYELVNVNNLSIILGNLLNAQEIRDYVLLADLYQLTILPYLYQLQEYIISKEEDLFDHNLYELNVSAFEKTNKDLYQCLRQNRESIKELSKEYHIEFTSCGLRTLTIHSNGNTLYLHSNHNVMSEAFTLASSWFQEDKSEYIVYGLGLGYHVDELSKLDSGITIDVYESDINVIKMACAYSNLHTLVQNSNIHIYYDPDFIKLTERLKKLNEEAEFVLHYPSLRAIKDMELQDKLDSYFVQYSSYKNQSRFMNGNFRENILNFDDTVDTLRDEFAGKDLYIVAAGPSLDKNFRRLRLVGEQGIILATGTVFKKLLNVGIKPDYFIVSDASERIYAQIEDREYENVPMLFLSTASKSFAKNYKGKKYIICQRDYAKAEEFAKENGYNLYETGGSVSTTALDIGIQFKCRRIIFLGLDLGYTDNLAHATGTSLRAIQSTENLKQVVDIYGNPIYTTKILDIYRRWMEDRIQDVKDIEIIDATEGGARINGMKIMKLYEITGPY